MVVFHQTHILFEAPNPTGHDNRYFCVEKIDEIQFTAIKEALQELLRIGEILGFAAVEVNSGSLHRKVGGYPGQDHRMPICCEVMYYQMAVGDEIFSQPES